MKTILHTCCAPCSIMCIEALKKENITPTLFWFNPNIHPYTEYKNRHEALKKYASEQNIELVDNDIYGLRDFLNGIRDTDNRCDYCYEVRLEETAKYATTLNASFSTTLLISPYQNHEKICDIGNKLAKKYNTTFLYRDFRPYFREGQSKAREQEIYMQKYCGCIFSEEERYLKTKRQKP